MGFDPGLTQTANTGVFRYRWVPDDAAVHLEGACGRLPIVIAPAPGVCFTVATEEVTVYAEPGVSSVRLATMAPSEYGEVLSSVAKDWVRVEPIEDNPGVLSGWIQRERLNLNGLCEGLPALQP